jgi:hypothetical protein
VPAPIIRHVLDAIERGGQARIPALGLSTQGLENPALRRHLGLPDGKSGVLVLSVDYGGSAWGTLEPGDVILEIAGMPIANNSTVHFRGRYRTRFDVSMGWSAIGANLTLSVWRKGEVHKLSFPLRPPAPLVPRSQYDRPPTYFIHAGLVFQTLTRDFLATWESWWDKAPKEFLHLYYAGNRTPERNEVVVLTQVLADEINVGYEHLYSESVVSVNGVMPRDMADFAARVAARGKVEIRTSSNGIIVLDGRAARAANRRILARYHIVNDRSRDLDPTAETGRRPTRARPARPARPSRPAKARPSKARPPRPARKPKPVKIKAAASKSGSTRAAKRRRR